MHQRRLLRVSTLALLAGVQWGCHTAANTSIPTTAGQRLTPHAQQARLEQRDCYVLGVFAFQVAQARDTTGLTQAEARSMLAQALTQRLQTTAAETDVIATGRRLHAVVEYVYRFPAWTPEGAALQTLTLCLEHYDKPH